MTPGATLLLALAAFTGGVINSVAGGGTLVSFPAAIAAGLPPIVANATNAVAMTPASLASAWAYRRELASERSRLALLAAPSLLGGALGSLLLLSTPAAVFDAVVPALVLGATTLLFVQNLRSPAEPTPGAAPTTRTRAFVVVVQLLVSIYGGYFGAGMGILMLAAFGLLAIEGIHRMNALKSVLGALINGTATVLFLASGSVDLRAAAVMALSATIGGFVGAAIARRVPARVVRWVVVAIGVVLTALLARKKWG